MSHINKNLTWHPPRVKLPAFNRIKNKIIQIPFVVEPENTMKAQKNNLNQMGFLQKSQTLPTHYPKNPHFFKFKSSQLCLKEDAFRAKLRKPDV